MGSSTREASDRRGGGWIRNVALHLPHDIDKWWVNKKLFIIVRVPFKNVRRGAAWQGQDPWVGW